MTVDSRLLAALRWRCIGPPRGGRVSAVAGDPVNPARFYFGACAGGVWKTEDAGAYWVNISDGFFTTAAVGAIAVAESDPAVIYAGTGEAALRGNVSHGDGVYKSTDAGKTWVNVGLRDTRHIARIRIHPQNPNLVYVAALGHAFGPNDERGVFRSSDGGNTWQRILFRDPDTGAIDLCLDPTNPRILYASLWQVRRTFWSLSSGGPGSGLFMSTDGGDSWTELTDRPGLPGGLKGRIGVAAAPKSGRVWALIEAEQGGLYRSDDSGATWQLTSDDRNLRHRPWYYMHVFADPTDPDTLHVLNLKHLKSIDAGKTFGEITTPHGDNHDLWIDPRNPNRMVQGNDGGACVSLNGGESWSTIYNQMTAQFYHVAVDNQFPYRVYGTQQDNSSISTPSRAPSLGCIPWGSSYAAGTGESGHIAIKPDDPNIVLVGAVGSSPGGGGALQRYDHRSGQIRLVTVWPEIYGGWGAKDLKYRFQWTFPILFSPHDPNLLYTCGNVAFRSTDLGGSWEPFSPDLTRADVEKLGPSGGPITKDTTGAEHYATIFAFAESPHTPGVFWAGSDDGLVHRSADNGASWQLITPAELPEWALISNIECSPHDPSTAYLAATRYKLADNRPLLYKTTDNGASWQLITSGIPADDFTRVIRCDPARPGLLYCGTETRIYVSFDDGASWQPLGGNLPVVPIHDMVVKEHDLVVATHGRSFWILDDLTPLHQISDAVARTGSDQGPTTNDQRPTTNDQPQGADGLSSFVLGPTSNGVLESKSRAHLLQPRDTIRTLGGLLGWRGSDAGKNYMLVLGSAGTFYLKTGPNGEEQRTFIDAGENPPAGVVIHYWLSEAAAGEPSLSLTVRNDQNNEVRSYTRKPEGAKEGGPWLPAQPGMNRLVWNMRHADAVKLPGDPTTENGLAGPLVAPGVYTLTLQVGASELRQSVTVLKDPRTDATEADFAAQEALLLAIRDKLSATHRSLIQLREVRRQIEDLTRRSAGLPAAEAIKARADPIVAALTAVEEELVQTKAKTAFDTINLPSRLNAKLAALTSVFASADAAPTAQARAVFADLAGRIDAQLAALRDLLTEDVADLNQLAAEQAVAAVVVLY